MVVKTHAKETVGVWEWYEGPQYRIEISTINKTPSKSDSFKHTGPLTITDEERNEILIGVASWGYKCGSADAPGVYAKVTSVLTWIDDIVFRDNQG